MKMSGAVLVALALLLLLIEPAAPILPARGLYRMDVPKKCCIIGYIFNDDFSCVKATASHSILAQLSIGEISPIAPGHGIACSEDATVPLIDRPEVPPMMTYSTGFVPSELCVETTTNGTEVLARCPELLRMVIMGHTLDGSKSRMCESLATVIFWGAQTYMPANMAHVILCMVVVVTYLTVPELGKSVHNRAVLRHNVCLLALGCILTFLGYCSMCSCQLCDNINIFLWLSLQYFTNATVFWLNVICFDMTLSITRFRWMVGPGKRSDSEENQRLRYYGTFAWGAALVPTILAAILEYWPGVPEDLPLKPNYHRYSMGPNPAVNYYFFAVPVLTLFFNNVLFMFTTYKILRIQRSTEFATKSNDGILTKKYFLFLRLYLLMGAPWFFGSLLAVLNQLVILKMCRLVQPILWLVILFTQEKFRQQVIMRIWITKKEQSTNTNSP